MSQILRFKGSQHFRQRLLLSTLSGRPIRIDDIRLGGGDNVGLLDFEASLLRLIEQLTNGCSVAINETGTSLKYRPGVVTGGTGVEHDCGTTRGIGYFLEPLVLMCLFGKRPLSITLRGVTNDTLDPSVDTFRTVTLPLLKRLTGAEGEFELKVVSRGAAPGGGGQVLLRVPVVKQLPGIDLLDEGMVKRIRGVAFTTKVSPQVANRMVDGARGVLNQLLADVYIFTDAVAGKESGASPGYGMTLVAETTSGCLLSAECCATQGSSGAAAGAPASASVVVPEEVGAASARLLLEEVSRGGVVDSTHQGLLLMLCALGPEEANQIRLGPLTPHAVRTLRHIKDFFGITFSIRPEPDSRTIFLTCLGSGIKNLSKKVT